MKNQKQTAALVVFSLAALTLLTGCGSSGSSSWSSTKLVGGNIVGASLSLTGTTATVAGTAGTSGSANGTGTAATFNEPFGITTDGTNLYIADSYNCTIRKMVISTAVVSTLAGTTGTCTETDGTGTSATFNDPMGITTDGTNLYVADYRGDTIRKVVISTGAVTTLVASGTLDYPVGITTDGTNLYVADSANRAIRKVVISTGAVTTLAGTVGTSGTTDGTGTAALFEFPVGITTDGTNLYVTDYYVATIRKIVISSGVVTTLAGKAGTTGLTNGTGTAATFSEPNGIATDGTNLYVADAEDHAVRKIVISTGVVTTLAGGTTTGTADGIGTAAEFEFPWVITATASKLYLVDLGANTIRSID
jgi:hypothetical protein